MPQTPPHRASAPAEVLANLSLGYNGYTDPTLTKPQMWLAAVNVYSGAFGAIERCRFANVVTLSPFASVPFTSLKYYAPSGAPSSYLLADTNGKLFSFDAFTFAQTQRLNPYVDPSGAGSSSLNGPWMREVLQNIAYEMNGTVKQAGRAANAATIEGWGLDTPDTSPQVAIASGTNQTITGITRANGVVTATLAGALTIPGGNNVGFVNISGVTDTSFNGSWLVTSGSGTNTLTWTQFGQNTSSSAGTADTKITKATGRSYAWAWENANKVTVSSPSPATQYLQYAAQNGAIQLIQAGAIAITNGSATVTGTGTFFTSAWIGRSLWMESVGNLGRITAVASGTSLTLSANAGSTVSGKTFQVYDPQATHLRLYATADGGATYLRVARNSFDKTQTTLTASGLQFFDNSNSEPPNSPFTSETVQANNIPPPIGQFLGSYQGRIVIYGVSGAPQTLFYTNSELTNIGQPQECCAPLNQFTLPIQNGQIFGTLEFPGSLIIWSDKQDMFRLTGLLSDNSTSTAVQQGATIARLPYALGCASPQATAVTPLGGIWLTSNGEVWLYTDRYAPRNIGRPIQDILNSIDSRYRSLARMKYYHNSNRNWLTLAVPANGATYNNTILVLDLDLLASNGSPSYFTFDMATNSPSWFVFKPGPQIFSSNITSVVLGEPSNCTVVTSAPHNAVVGARVIIVGATNIDGVNGEHTVTSVINSTTFVCGVGNLGEGLVATTGTVTTPSNNPQSSFCALRADAIEVIFDFVGNMRILVAELGLIQDVDYTPAFSVGSEIPLGQAFVQLHPWGNDSPYIIKRPSWFRFNTNREPSTLAADGWSFRVDGVDDDFYTFASPLSLALTPGVNDSSTLCGNPNLSSGSAFRHSPEMFRIGGVNFVMGRRLLFTCNFPLGTGLDVRLRSIQVGFGASPPR